MNVFIKAAYFAAIGQCDEYMLRTIGNGARGELHEVANALCTANAATFHIANRPMTVAHNSQQRQVTCIDGLAHH